jgi:hypothetical protein
MTPQEKADELIRKYYRNSDLIAEDLIWTQAKECALIAVDEILDFLSKSQYNYVNTITHWQEIKQEIENYD